VTTDPGRLELRLLGEADLRRSDGPELTDVVRQPKRLAILAYLAVEGPGRFHRRDSLLALFWPEMDDHHARASLRRTLHFLRTHLGDGALDARGDEIAVSEAVWSDVAALGEALDEGRLEAALDLYRGDLLAGFFVPTAPGFERWLDGERERLRRLASGAAWQLAEAREAAGDVVGAGTFGRRAAALAPDDEVALRRMLALFDRLGDRAAAVQVYDDFARRLKSELDLDPSPETRAMVADIRARAELRTPPAPRAPTAPPPIAPNRVAILPFTVRGGPHLGYLREGLVDLLSVKLDGAADLSTVDPHALLASVGSGGAEELGPDAGRAVATRFGAGQFLLGSAVSAGARLLVHVSLYQTAGGAEVRMDGEVENEDGIATLVDDLVRRLLAGRSTSLGGHLGRLGATMTGSLPALKSYLAGERLFRAGRYVEAAGSSERALAADDAFGLARYRLAAARSAAGRLDDARREAEGAMRGRHLSVHVRLLLSAQVAWLNGDLTTAERRYLAVLDERPEDVDAWFGLARLLFDANPLRGGRAVAARDPSRRTLDLDPRHVGAIAQLARLAALERQPAEMEALIERFLALSPEGDDATALLAVRAGAGGEAAAGDALFQRLAAAPPMAVARSALDLALTAADPSARPDFVERFSRLPAAAALQGFPAIVDAHLAAAHDAPERAARSLQQAERHDAQAALAHRAWLAAAAPDPDPAAGTLLQRLETWTPTATDALPPTVEPWFAIRAYLRGLLAARLGRFDDAEARAGECAGSSEEPSLAAALAGGVRARVALGRGDAKTALEILAATTLGPWIHRAAWSPFAALALERLARGEALVALGKRDEAGPWLQGLGERSVFELVCRSRGRTLLA
jgi:serine/threonine-protein kinase